MIVGCDKHAAVHTWAAGHVLFGTCHDKLLNAGTYVGVAKDIRHLLAFALRTMDGPKSDDQRILTRYCRRFPSRVHIDCDNLFFLTYVINYSGFKKVGCTVDEHGTVSYNGVRPFVAHGPTADMSDLIAALGYDISPGERRDIVDAMKRGAFRKILHYAQHPAFVMALMSIIFAVGAWAWRRS